MKIIKCILLNFSTTLLILHGAPACGQIDTIEQEEYTGLSGLDSTGPRKKMDYNKPGHYEMVIQLDKPQVNKGDVLRLKIYFSGYGSIGGSKVIGGLPSKLIDGKKSYVQWLLSKEINNPWWGSHVDTLFDADKASGFILEIIGLKYDTWKYSTPYIDYNQDLREKQDSQDLRIMTEMNLINPPIVVNLKTFDNADPGNYTINMVYTYYDGKQWATIPQAVKFRINNLLEQYPILFTIFAIIVSCLGAPEFFLAFGKRIIFIYKFLLWKLFKVGKNRPLYPVLNVLKDGSQKNI